MWTENCWINPYEDDETAGDETDAADETEEETAAETEEETSAAAKETTAAVKETVKETTKANPQPTQAAAVNSGNLKLNADTLQEASDKGGTNTYEKTELFDGSTGKLTMGDVYNCLSKYGKTEWVSQKLPYELKVANVKGMDPSGRQLEYNRTCHQGCIPVLRGPEEESTS